MLRRIPKLITLVDERVAAESIDDQTATLEYWIGSWASAYMGNNVGTIIKEVGDKKKSVEGMRAISNYSVAEDDSMAAIDMQRFKKLEEIDSAIDSLPQLHREAIYIRHRLRRIACWRFPALELPDAYDKAREQLRLLLIKRNILLSKS